MSYQDETPLYFGISSLSSLMKLNYTKDLKHTNLWHSQYIPRTLTYHILPSTPHQQTLKTCTHKHTHTNTHLNIQTSTPAFSALLCSMTSQQKIHQTFEKILKHESKILEKIGPLQKQRKYKEHKTKYVNKKKLKMKPKMNSSRNRIGYCIYSLYRLYSLYRYNI
jgi:hypothetical protein